MYHHIGVDDFACTYTASGHTRAYASVYCVCVINRMQQLCTGLNRVAAMRHAVEVDDKEFTDSPYLSTEPAGTGGDVPLVAGNSGLESVGVLRVESTGFRVHFGVRVGVFFGHMGCHPGSEPQGRQPWRRRPSLHSVLRLPLLRRAVIHDWKSGSWAQPYCPLAWAARVPRMLRLMNIARNPSLPTRRKSLLRYLAFNFLPSVITF